MLRDSSSSTSCSRRMSKFVVLLPMLMAAANVGWNMLQQKMFQMMSKVKIMLIFLLFSFHQHKPAWRQLMMDRNPSQSQISSSDFKRFEYFHTFWLSVELKSPWFLQHVLLFWHSHSFNSWFPVQTSWDFFYLNFDSLVSWTY